MHKAHFSWNTFKVVIWLNFTGFPEDVQVALFNGPPANNTKQSDCNLAVVCTSVAIRIHHEKLNA